MEGDARTHANDLVNRIREHVDAWRTLPPSQWMVMYETQRLLTHWRDAARDKPLFFCQVEAAETVIWLTEVAGKGKGTKEQEKLYDAIAAHSEAANPGLSALP